MTQPCPDQVSNAVMEVQRQHISRWERRRYNGGPYHSNVRKCSYCGSIHPDDLIAAVEKGAQIEGTTKGYKLYALIPNLVAGKRVRNGSTSGPVFEQQPIGVRLNVRDRLFGPHNMPERLGEPTIAERLSGYYKRDTYGEGPPTTFDKVYMWHFTPEDLDRLKTAVARHG